MVVCWGVARSLPFEECPRWRSHLAVMRGLASVLTPPKNVEGDEPPWTEEMDCPSFTSSSVRPQTQIFRESGP